MLLLYLLLVYIKYVLAIIVKRNNWKKMSVQSDKSVVIRLPINLWSSSDHGCLQRREEIDWTRITSVWWSQMDVPQIQTRQLKQLLPWVDCLVNIKLHKHDASCQSNNRRKWLHFNFDFSSLRNVAMLTGSFKLE